MVFRLSKPAKAGLCFPKHALICILIITLIIKIAAELPVTQNFNSSNCWGVGVLGGGGGGAHACIIIIVIGLYAWM